MSIRRITIEEYLQMPTTDVHDELCRGRVVTRPMPGDLHGSTVSHVTELLTRFVGSRQLGRVGGRAGVITHRSPDTMRGPDLSYWSLAQCESRGCWHHEMVPDMVAEVVDQDESFEILRAKAEEYLEAGVRRVWLIDPFARKVCEHVAAVSPTISNEQGTLNGGDVLPGFACRVSALFE